MPINMTDPWVHHRCDLLLRLSYSQTVSRYYVPQVPSPVSNTGHGYQLAELILWVLIIGATCDCYDLYSPTASRSHCILHVPGLIPNTGHEMSTRHRVILIIGKILNLFDSNCFCTSGLPISQLGDVNCQLAAELIIWVLIIGVICYDFY